MRKKGKGKKNYAKGGSKNALFTIRVNQCSSVDKPFPFP